MMSERAAAAKRVLRRKRKQVTQKTKELRIHFELRTAIAQQKFLEVSIPCIIKVTYLCFACNVKFMQIHYCYNYLLQNHCHYKRTNKH